MPISSPGSEDSFKRITEWSSICGQHPNCRGLHNTVLPHRVIDVVTASPDVVLVETAGETGGYHCLSYPWGEKPQMLKTTTATLEEHKRLIPFPTLPPMFQDAVEITRRLQIRWLWIDALCIIQDSAEDKDAEIAKMSSIYSNASLTISASASCDSSGRCFEDMEICKQTKIYIETEEQDSSVIYFRVLDTFKGPGCAEIRGYGGYGGRWGASDTYLLSRAWVMQERLLSARVLHCAESEMVWECRSGVMCECSPTAVEQFGVQGIKKLFSEGHDIAIRAPVSSPSLTWHKLSGLFYTCDISFPEDQLPALSGLARQYQRNNPTVGDYLAGIWLADLPEGLLWWCDLKSLWGYTGGNHPVEGRLQYRHEAAPSWAWTSLYGSPSEFDLIFGLEESGDLKNSIILANVVSAQCTPKGSDEFGATVVGRITLEAPFTPVRRGVEAIHTEDGHNRSGEEYSESVKRYIDTIISGAGAMKSWNDENQQCIDPQSCNVGFTVDCWETDSMVPAYEDGGAETEQGTEPSKFACVILAKLEVRCSSRDRGVASFNELLETKRPAPRKIFHPRVMGLLLKTSPSYPGCYERVGYVCAGSEFFPETETKAVTLV